MKKPLTFSKPDTLAGMPILADTRVPIRTLMDYLVSGFSMNEFLEDFPAASRAQAVRFLKEARAKLSGSLGQAHRRRTRRKARP